MSNKNTGYAADINIINVNTIVEGKITTKGNFRIDGRVIGTILSEGSGVIGPSGEIEGELQVKTLVSGGKFKGKLTVKERTVLESTAVFTGDLITKKLIIEEGAIFDGTCVMSGNSNGNAGTVKQG